MVQIEPKINTGCVRQPQNLPGSKFQQKHELIGRGDRVVSPVLPSPPLPPPDLSAGSILAVRTLPALLPSPKRQPQPSSLPANTHPPFFLTQSTRDNVYETVNRSSEDPRHQEHAGEP